MAGFVIPNKADVGADNSQAQLDATDFRTIVAGFDVIGVVAGANTCAVTATGTPDQNVQIAVGEVLAQGVHRTVAAGALAMPAAHATLNRYDLVVIDAAGVKRARSGPEAVSPVFPVPTAGDVVLAAVWRPAADNTIAGGDIVDKRIIIRNNYWVAAGGLGGGQTLVGGRATGENLVLRSNALDDGQIILRVATNPGNLPVVYPGRHIVIENAVGTDLFSFDYFDSYQLGLDDIATSQFNVFAPRDGTRTVLGLSLGAGAIADGQFLAMLEAHGMREGNHEPGVQHISFYTDRDAWGSLATLVNDAAGIPSEASALSRTFAVDDTALLTVGAVICVWDATKTPGVNVPDATFEYMKVTARSVSSGAGTVTCTRGWWAAFQMATVSALCPSHPDNARIFVVTRTTFKWLQMNTGPSTDSSGVARLQLGQGTGTEVDLNSSALLINGNEGVTNRGDARWAWDQTLRSWDFTDRVRAAYGMFSADSATQAARLHVREATITDEVQRLESVATNDDPRQSTFQARVATTDATPTTMGLTKSAPVSTTTGIEAVVVARRTGGSAGTAEDGAMYVIRAVVKNVAGVATLIGSTSITTVAESQAGWNADIGVLSGVWYVFVTGVVNNNITWHATIRTWPVGS